MAQHRRGFSLIELAVVLAISGLVTGFVLQSSQRVNAPECYAYTKSQMAYIQAKIERFARDKDRLPLPAKRDVGIDDPSYGRETTAAYLDEIGTGTKVTYGALPFQTLGLPTSYAGDCWGNKFTYAVTTALTTSATSGGFLDSTVVGNITIKTAAATNFLTTAAYAVISHGEDELGAVKTNYNDPVSHKWCSGWDIKHLNCNIAGYTLADAQFNNGKDADTSYFDDLILYAGKPQRIVDATGNLYCWGDNGVGQLGDNTTTQRSVPTLVTLPTGVSFFTKVSAGYQGSCGIGNNGLAYCWGDNTGGQIGDNSTTARSIPTLVTLPSGVASFTSIAYGGFHACGIGNNGLAYCWGLNLGLYQLTQYCVMEQHA